MTEVVDQPDRSRLVVEQDGHTAELVYRLEPGRMVLIHTGVPEAMGGHGIAGDLLRAAVARAAAEGRTVVPWCPYARRWLRAHPDEAAGVEIDWSDRP